MMTRDPSPLVGLAVGDALGMPFETASMFDARLLSWDGSFQPSEFHKLKPGQWTDDTMMSLCLAQSLVERQGYDAVDAAARYLAWYKSGDHRGMGNTTREALRRLSIGDDWTISGQQGAQGNGTAMRAGVLGAYYKATPNSAADFARIDATITHRSLEAEEGSVAIAVGVAYLCDAAQKWPTLEKVIAALRPSKVRDGLVKVASLYRDKLNIGSVLGDSLQTGAHVVQTVPAAFAAFMLTSSYMEGVDASIRAGGDTDTTAAIAGGLAGAYYGHQAIPPRYLSQLEQYTELRTVESKLFG